MEINKQLLEIKGSKLRGLNPNWWEQTSWLLTKRGRRFNSILLITTRAREEDLNQGPLDLT